MKVLGIQGSPRPKVSNTDILLKEFLNGAQSQGAETETVYLKEKEIRFCVGCFTCWTKIPGVCVFKDDMPELLEKVRSCDIIVYATPLYNYNMTAVMKAFQERLLPLMDPHFEKMGDRYHHPQRYAVSRKMVLISNCGFPEVSHFDALRHVFRKMEQSSGFPLIGELLMPGGEMLKNKGFMERFPTALQAAFQAGVEAVRDGRISKQTEELIQKPLIPPDDIAEMANLWWDSRLKKGVQPGREDKIDDMRILLRGMALMFNPKAAGDLRATLQFEVSGAQPGNWFLAIEDGKCTFHEGKAESPTLTIQTPAEVWLAIANKEIEGPKALMEGKYKAQGDMGLLMRIRNLFG